MKTSLKLAIILLPVLLVICGCVSESQKILYGYNTWKTKVIIGAALPLSGPEANSGKAMRRGAEMAVEMLNSQRGIAGNQVVLKVADSYPSPEKAVEKLKQAKVSAIVGGFTTQEAERLAQTANAERIPLIIPIASGENLTINRPLVKAISCNDRQQGESLAAYLWYWRQIKNLSILYPAAPEQSFERNVSRLMAQSFSDLGGQIVSAVEYGPDNMEEAIRSVLRTGPEAVMVPAIGKEAAQLIKLLRHLGYEGLICGADGWDHADFIPALGKNFQPGECIFVGSFSKHFENDEFEIFKERFAGQFHYQPGSDESITADAVLLLSATLPGANTVFDYEKNWAYISHYFGVASRYSALPNGTVDRIVFINYLIKPGIVSEYPEIGLIRYFHHSRLESYKYD